MTVQTISPAGWKPARGYSHAVRAGDRIAVAGLVGCDPAVGSVPEGADFVAQWSAIWDNLSALLAGAGSSPGQVSMLRIYLTDLDAYRSAGRALGESWKKAFGDHLPAITMVEVTGLLDPNALLEVDAEAVV
ncbi:RidA family protein [Cumulibacter manganitolerans]|uniref:RidA family protein n=1 Tax=Cumulibacter manganitolerans TaxID=1884992 RepID=UPI001296D8C7|nr:Rid family hydrolase [Cumulibacter manganitolerans]